MLPFSYLVHFQTCHLKNVCSIFLFCPHSSLYCSYKLRRKPQLKSNINHLVCNWLQLRAIIVYGCFFNHEPLAFCRCRYPKSSISFKLLACLHYLVIWHKKGWTFSTQHWLSSKRWSVTAGFNQIKCFFWGGCAVFCLALFLQM